MYIVMRGELVGMTLAKGEHFYRERIVEQGDSVNILCVLKVYNLCVETILCTKGALYICEQAQDTGLVLRRQLGEALKPFNRQELS